MRNTTSAVAACLSGQMRTFPHANAWRHLRATLFNPLAADLFLVIVYGTGATASLPQSQLQMFRRLSASAFDALDALQPISITMGAHPETDLRKRHFATGMRSQFANTRACFDSVVSHERGRGRQYRWIVRARFDSWFAHRIPSLAALETRLDTATAR
jgi:hypothetical protein